VIGERKLGQLAISQVRAPPHHVPDNAASLLLREMAPAHVDA
jgi:hypothetical protein